MDDQAGPRFRIIARYCYAPIQSARTFAAKSQARAELRKWKKQAKDQGQHLIGRVVTEVED